MQVKIFHGANVIDSREVAEMVGRGHNELLKSIRNYSDHLAEGEIPLSEFFIESSYKDSTGRELPCYFITRKGCDLIANKLTGRKGTLFTAAYVTAFDEMQCAISARNTPELENLSGLASIMRAVDIPLAAQKADPETRARQAKLLMDTYGVPRVPDYVKENPWQLSLYNTDFSEVQFDAQD